MLPGVNHKPKSVGRLGKELGAESGRDTLYTASMNALSVARAHLGTLDKVTGVVRLGIYLATSGDFFEQPYVADAASELFEGIFSLLSTKSLHFLTKIYLLSSSGKDWQNVKFGRMNTCRGCGSAKFGQVITIGARHAFDHAKYMQAFYLA